MSFLIEQAGGKAITGLHRIMDIVPSGVHQRVPVIMGSRDDVDECQKYYDREAAKNPALKARCDERMVPGSGGA